MAISTEQVQLLNRYGGWAASLVQLGTLIQNAESVLASEIALADGKILVGNASNVAAAQTVSGDITISNGGVAAIAAGVIVNADVSASAAVDFSKLAALTSGNILVGSAGNVATSVALSGDATIVASGALTIANDAITTAKINADAVDNSKLADDSVSLEQLDSGIEFSHRVFAAGEFTTAGGDTAESITVAGALATDLAVVVLKTPGAAPTTVTAAAAASGAINVTMGADPSTDHVLTYMLLRAAT